MSGPATVPRSSVPPSGSGASSPGCHGEPPLTARLERWMAALAADPGRLDALLREHGSPLNLHQSAPFARNAAEIRDAGDGLGVEPRVYFARKANKCLTFVREADRLGLGVDVAGELELEQTLAEGIAPERIVLTAAVKPESLLQRCIESGITVAIDNLDELGRLGALADGRDGPPLPLALRLTPGRLQPERPRSRFGLDAGAAPEAVRLIDDCRGRLALRGLHFHLDGYSAGERVATLAEAIELADRLAGLGHELRFVDIGGGFPISYLNDGEQWERFWAEHRRALLGRRAPLTFGGHGLGLRASAGRIEGAPAVYPYWQQPVRGEWLRGILTTNTRIGRHEETIADALAGRGLELRCEPGRALLDGCGVTAARVEFTKPYGDGEHLVGLAMNRTQCRSSSDDFLVDPLLVGGPRDAAGRAPVSAGYLVGAYCIERELLSWRRLRFPGGVARGDMVVFPNTAGYLMHILESSSHQMPLARNLHLEPGPGGGAELDPIDGRGGPAGD